MSMNKLIVAGNLASDARFNNVSDKQDAVSFTVIANKRVKDDAAEGGYRDAPTAYQVTRFLPKGESAAKLAAHLTRGRRVEVEGPYRKNVKPNTNETTGKTYHGWTLIADEIELGAKPKEKVADAA